MRWAAIVLAAVLVLAAGMGSAQAPPVKLALVIGNADYDGGGIDVTPQGVAESTAGGYVPDLRNPINDATDIRDALARIGFKVDFVTDADGPTMSAALATFGTKVAEAPDSAQVVIYYAGHAMQVDGVNYLIPARARLPQVDFSRMPSRQGYSVIESVTVPIQRVVDQFREPRAPGVNLLILDACRDNPWDSRVRGLTRNTSPNAGGLAQVAAPTRTIVSFSTALNRKAQDGGERDRNSPFAAALKDAIGKPGTIAEMLDGVGTTVEAATFGRQSPWYQSASVGRVCLATCPTEGTAAFSPRLGANALLGKWIAVPIENRGTGATRGILIPRAPACLPELEIRSVTSELEFRFRLASEEREFTRKNVISINGASVTVSWNMLGPATFSVDAGTRQLQVVTPDYICRYRSA